MASEGVWDTPWDAMFWVIYTDLHEFATRGAELESGQFDSATLVISGDSVYYWVQVIFIKRILPYFRQGINYWPLKFLFFKSDFIGKIWF